MLSFAMPLPMVTSEVLETKTQDAFPEGAYKTHRRFDRAARLFGEQGLHQLMSSRVLIFGMGGVGSFAAEALARSGVGQLVLIDFDDVCVTNTNRQLHALKGNIGKPKAQIMAERLALIHPTGNVEAKLKFYQPETSAELLDGKIDFVVDAIDSISNKAHLLATCVARKIPVVSSMGAAAKWDPTRIRTSDLSDTEVCPLARDLRRILRQQYNLPCERGGPRSGITAVFSDEPATPPAPLSYDEGTGFQCVCPNRDNGLYTCDKRARIDGSASFVTGAFGLTAASVVVRALSRGGR